MSVGVRKRTFSHSLRVTFFGVHTIHTTGNNPVVPYRNILELDIYLKGDDPDSYLYEQPVFDISRKTLMDRKTQNSMIKHHTLRILAKFIIF